MKQFFYLLVFLLLGCAQQTALTGGIKDVTPPKIDTSKTFPEINSINYKGQEIKLVFNENILYQESNNSFISNPPVGKHDLTVEKNTLYIQLKAALKENTTYTLIFHNSIVDLNEKNKIDDLRFSFSTGPIIDSITVNGKAINSLDKSPSANFMVSLKSAQPDSLVYTCLTNKNGEYFLSHLKPGEYDLFAWEDLNENNKLDSLNEPQGFLSNKIRVEDSCCQELLNTYLPIKNLEIEKIELNTYGKLTLVFNQMVDSLSIRTLDSSFSKDIISKDDEVSVWISDSNVTSYSFIINAPSLKFKDTILVKKSNDSDKEKKLSFQKEEIKNLVSPKSLHLIFNQELISIDTSLLILGIDSTLVKYSYIIKHNELILSPELKSGSFNITAYPGSFSGFWNTKMDTSKIYFSIIETSKLGSLTLDVNNSLGENFIIQLLSNNAVIHEFYSDSSAFNKTLERVLPGEYDLRLILDKDKNKSWTTGNLRNKTQPEEVIYLDRKVVIQKNWEEFILWNL